MKIHGLPEKFWVVTEPSPGSELDDICFACDYERLMRQALGGLREDEIVGLYAGEDEARKAAARLLGELPVCPSDAVIVEVVVNVMVMPNHEEMTAGDLAMAAVEAVRSAVRQGEEAGFRHRLAGRVSLGAGPVELRNLSVITG